MILRSSGLHGSGSDLLSHTVARAVPSALEGLTSVFGMGTGVAPPKLPPEFWEHADWPGVPLTNTKKSSISVRLGSSEGLCRLAAHGGREKFENISKPHELLVPVSSTHCCASTSGLSTS